MIGALSDRTISRWGRRRPYLVFGAAGIIGMTLLFWEINSEEWSTLALFLWVMVVFYLANSAYTNVFVPYSALTPDLAQDFLDRTNLNGCRMAWAIVGTIVGAGAFTLVVDLAADRGLGSEHIVAGTVFVIIVAVAV